MTVMQCQICGKPLAGRAKKACGRINGKPSPCRIKLYSIQRRQAGRLRKKNIDSAKYARKLQRNKKWADKQRAKGAHRVTWNCVTCGELFEVKRYSEWGYHCSPQCRADWHKLPKEKTTKFYGNNCVVCGDSFITQHSPHRYCSPPCKYKARPDRQWIPPRVREAIYERDQWVCQLCHKPVDKNQQWNTDDYQPLWPSLDHITPRSKGGTDDWDNLQLTHSYCNSSKSDQNIDTLPPPLLAQTK